MNEKYIEVLPQYDFEVLSVRRGRGAWICETSQGLKLLREYKGTLKRLEFEEQVLNAVEELSSQPGFKSPEAALRTEHYVRNREEQLFSMSEDGTRFCLKDWFLDRECNLKENGEVISAVRCMASLHKVLKQIPFQEEWLMGSSLGAKQSEEMERRNRELRRARTFISKKRKKTDFELALIGGYDKFYQQAMEAAEGMKQTEADEIQKGMQETAGESLQKAMCQTAEEQQEDVPNQGKLQRSGMYLCHGELNQHHILMGSSYIAITEFGRMHLGFQTEDLYHFLRKVMEKHDWSLWLGLSILEAYNAILPLNSLERSRLYYMFLYPEKYWKQVNYYYNANKAWIPAKNVEKLQTLEQQQENRNRFLSKIIET